MTHHPPRSGGAGRWSVSRRWVAGALAAAAAIMVATIGRLWAQLRPAGLTDAEMAALFAEPIEPPTRPLRVFHLGHSLVGRDMPAMLEQLAAEGHRHESQLGWGTTLQAHWEPDVGIAGFEAENAHPRYRDAREALLSGEYDAVVVTEMVEIRDAIRYFDSPGYLARWAERAREGNPQVRVYLYETWHRLDDPEGWLERLDRDLGRHWEADILRPALAADPAGRPIFLIPAGQVLARLVREVERQGGVEGLRGREDLFGRGPDGSLDPIHLNDLGHYLVALAHFAVLYHRSPVGLPRELRRADGSPAAAPSPAAARLMQEAAWAVATSQPMTGVAPDRG
jgi:hypothetical protein